MVDKEEVVPNLSEERLSMLKAGMTLAEVEAVLGPHSGPPTGFKTSVIAWIGRGAMLRARFEGQGKTLSHAVVDWPESQRILDLKNQEVS